MCFVEVIDTAGQGRLSQFLGALSQSLMVRDAEEYATLRDQWVRLVASRASMRRVDTHSAQGRPRFHPCILDRIAFNIRSTRSLPAVDDAGQTTKTDIYAGRQ